MKRMTKALIGAVAMTAVGFAGTSVATESAKDGVKAGDAAPTFTVTDIKGKEHNLQDYIDQDKVIVLEWFNPECPFVVKQYETNTVMNDTYNEFKDDGVVWIAINSGKPGKQGTGKEKNAAAAQKWKIEHPIVLDEDDKIGKMYGATNTPHMFVIADGRIAYAGAIDNERSPRAKGDTNYVWNALKSIYAGESVAEAQTKPYGCSVKY